MNRTLKKLVDTMKVGDVKKLNKLHALNMFKAHNQKAIGTHYIWNTTENYETTCLDYLIKIYNNAVVYISRKSETEFSVKIYVNYISVSDDYGIQAIIDLDNLDGNLEEVEEITEEVQEEVVNVEPIEEVAIEEKIIINPIVEHIEEKKIKVVCLVPSLNKNHSKEYNDEEIEESSYTNEFLITYKVIMTKKEYNYFINHLLEDYEFLSGKGGWSETDDGELEYFLGVAIVCQDEETLVIDPSGSSYARYTCRLVDDRGANLMDSKCNKKDEFENLLNQIENVALYEIDASEKSIVKDERIVVNEYIGKTVVTGKALKELINENFSVNIAKALVRKINNIRSFIEGISAMESGRVIELFSMPKATDGISFKQRLLYELERAVI